MKLSELKLTDKIFYGDKDHAETDGVLTLGEVKDLPYIDTDIKKLIIYIADERPIYYGVKLYNVLEYHLDHLDCQGYDDIYLEDDYITNFIDKYVGWEKKSSDELLNVVKENGYSIEEAEKIINNILFSKECQKENFTKMFYVWGDKVSFTKKDIENIKEKLEK